jgi:3',5'-cyclic AMP phosphodiesterase CpdA
VGDGLRFRDGRFKIAQVTDAHFCDGSAEDRRTLSLIERVLDAERPDLVLITGDFVDGSRCADPIATWLAAVQPFESRGVPWAAVFGNHDDEGSATREDLFAAQKTCAHCLTERGPQSLTGVGNFTLDIHGDGDLAARLYCFDSGGYAPNGPGEYAWIAHDQVCWYRSLAEAERGPALAFFHIPLPEYETAWAEGDRLGSRDEEICCPRINSGLFAAFHEEREVLGTFCGHDHLNDFEARLHGVRLCYGRASGYNTYPSTGLPRGVRIIELSEGVRAFDTWLRLDGDGLQTLRQAEPLT